MKDIQEMKCAGLSVTDISNAIGIDRKTVRKYIDNTKTPTYPQRTPRPRLLDPFKPYLQLRQSAGVWNATVLLRELRERGYQGGYTALTDYLHPLRKEAQRVAVRRFETPPGKQAQVDWGDIGHITLPDATNKSLSGFLMTLGCSRALFADIATDQTLPTLLRMHETAFHALGGVPQETLYDNMKTVVLKTLTQGVDERGEIRFNPTFLDFAHYWGFTPRLCRPYRPQTKGKVESSVKYLRYNFLCGREAGSLEDLRGQLLGWLAEVANKRVHGTTHRVVEQAWQEETPHLQPLASRPAYPLLPTEYRRVPADAFVSFRTNRYPVPWEAVGAEVCVHLVGDTLHILRHSQALVSHPVCEGKYQTLAAGELHKGMPYGGGRTQHKPKITLTQADPQVEQRSLLVYAEAAGCGEGSEAHE